MLEEQYKLAVEVPLPEEYRRLRVLAGLSPKSIEGAAVGLPNSFLGVVVRVEGNLWEWAGLWAMVDLHFS